MDVKQVYPGYGPNKKKLEMKYVDLPTPKSEKITHLMPKISKPVYRQHILDDDDVPFVDDLDDKDWEM